MEFSSFNTYLKRLNKLSFCATGFDSVVYVRSHLSSISFRCVFNCFEQLLTMRTGCRFSLGLKLHCATVTQTYLPLLHTLL